MSRYAFGRRLAASAIVLCTVAGVAVGVVAGPADAAARPILVPGDLLVSRLHYTGTDDLITPGVTVLPTGAVAIADGSFVHVWDNANVDGNFGVSAPIFLDQLTPDGISVSTTDVPTGTPGSGSRGHDLLSGSFSSKSEGALNLSTDGKAVTFMGYVVPADVLDASNANTPGVLDPTNPDAGQVYRGVGEVDRNGKFWFTETNAYSGDNGRAAILDAHTGNYFTAGNSNNGAGTSVPGLIYGTGAQLVSPTYETEDLQSPAQPTPAGGFSVTQLPANTKTDKLGKDTSFAGVTFPSCVLERGVRSARW